MARLRKAARRVRGALSTPTWLRDYSRADAGRDVLAGLTVGVMLVPQGMAYAVLAGLPAVYGLYASLVPLVVYAALGSARSIAFGIVAIDMLIVGDAITRSGATSPDQAAAVAIGVAALAGAVHIAMAALRLGWVVAYVSRPVVAGFMLAAPLLIGVGQVGNLLGVPWPRSTELVAIVAGAPAALAEIPWLPALTGLAAVALLLVVRRVSRRLPAALLVIVAATAAVELAPALADAGIARTGAIPASLPGAALPPLDLASIRELLGTVATLVLVQLMTIVTLGRQLSAPDEDDAVDANRELLALGAANLAGSVFSSPPVSASLSRSAVHVDAGGRSPMANAVAAGVVALSLAVAAPLLERIPMPALAAIIFVSALGMLSLAEVRHLLGIRPSEGGLAIATAALVLVLGVQEGVLLGVAASFVAMLAVASRPAVVEVGRVASGSEFRSLVHHAAAARTPGVIVVRIDGSLSFANADYVRRAILDRLDETPDAPDTLILDGRGVNVIDSTATRSFARLVDELEERGVALWLSNFKLRPRSTLSRAGLLAAARNDNVAAPTDDVMDAWLRTRDPGST